ncbi:ABC transporter ATP-binding protein [Spongiactinospora rosea]|uniref:ABC transporter ATP-binding protein n=1 Tax=Spongiactinospora rosea TaxID=2248750 RepID=A0A366LQM3_9ACTN|nr:ATP-binding cassette domain-containing protein [Spongiactinospora rosea]RBQ15833.1 ABC transporter ATP-binding protein [Spongiactinospora rosea]
MTVVRLAEVARVHGEGATAVHALRGVSLDVGQGELVAVMGPSGAGKSTLLNVAGGLDRPTSGTVRIGGQDLAAVRDLAALRRRSVGYVFQDLNLITSLTAAENVMLPRELDGVRSRRAREEAMAVLTEVGVADLADRFPDELSGGQSQRVAIARALVGERSLLLAATRLAATDMRPERATMAAIGAPPGTLRVIVAGQALYISGLGALVGLAAGTMTGVALSRPMTSYGPGDPATIAVPWAFVIAVVAGLPILGTAAALITRASPLPARRPA